MKVLLDTHIWLWSLLEPSRLAKRVATSLKSRSVELWLSPISIWETLILADKGRLALKPDARKWIRAALQAVPMVEAPLTNEIVLASGDIRLPHRDPADAFIAATAKVLGLTLVTSDRRLLNCKGVATFPNR